MSTAAYWGITVIIGSETSLAPARSNRYRGKLIAIEGLDAAGRTVQVRLLEGWLCRQGAPVSVCSAKPSDAQTPMTATLGCAAALYECIDEAIIPLLRAGRVVCVNGYTSMAAAEDAARGLSRKWIRNLYRRAVAANLRLYFRLPLEAAMRQARPPHSAYPQWSGNPEESFRLYQGRLVEEMDRLAAELDSHVIDATLPPEVQQREVREAVGRELIGKQDAASA